MLPAIAAVAGHSAADPSACLLTESSQVFHVTAEHGRLVVRKAPISGSDVEKTPSRAALLADPKAVVALSSCERVAPVDGQREYSNHQHSSEVDVAARPHSPEAT